MKTRFTLLLSLSTAIVAFTVVGCGGDDGGDTTTSQAADQTTTEASSSLTITMTDYKFTPQDATAKAGLVAISAPNEGQLEHELVLFKTDGDPSSLPLSGVDVDEEGAEKSGIEVPGEIADVEPGASKSGKFKLTPGKYLMVCNLPGHFKLGMYGTLTVK